MYLVVQAQFFCNFSELGCQNPPFRITQLKGRKSPPAFAAAKGGEKMKDSEEKRIQNQFGGFCTRILKNEADRKSTRLNSSHTDSSRMPSSA